MLLQRPGCFQFAVPVCGRPALALISPRSRKAFFLTTGRLEYLLGSATHSVSGHCWLVEMCLWTPWLHLGELSAVEDSEAIKLAFSPCPPLVKPAGMCSATAFGCWSFPLTAVCGSGHLRENRAVSRVNEALLSHSEPCPGICAKLRGCHAWLCSGY